MSDDRQMPVGEVPPWKRKLSNLGLFVFAIGGLGTCIQPLQGLYYIFFGGAKISLFWSIVLVVFALGTILASMVGSLFIMIGLAKSITLPGRPEGKIFDFLLPPEDAEYRALELEIAFDRWMERYSLQKAWTLYSIHTVSTVILYYVDRIKRGK